MWCLICDMYELVYDMGVFLTDKVLLSNCCVESNTEVEDQYQKKFEVWAEQERCCSCIISVAYI